MKITTDNTVIDLDGKTLNDNIVIQGPVRGVIVRNGTVRGEIRLRPDRIGGDNTPGHTERVRAVAPSGITVQGITFDTDGSTHQAYFGPGATGCSLIDCGFKGRSKGPSIYLSPEGGNHLVRGCTFSAVTGERREVLSVDGSEGNVITGNRFERCRWGGIYVYRNCGEDGRVRHQKPRDNMISDNFFNLKGMNLVRVSDGSGHQASLFYVPYGVILGSRQGDSAYCELDNEYDIGSGKSDLDFARNNIVRGNRFSGDWFQRHVRDNDKGNEVR